MTTDAQAALAQVREALAAGPTPGEWACYDDSNDGKTSRIEIVAIGKTVARIYRSVPEQDLPNARLIAACSPANIAAIIAHVEAQEVEIKRLREFAELWYFVMDEAPRDFERIVSEYQPKAWLQEAAKLRAASAAHPDRGGTDARMAEVNRAWEQAQEAAR